MLRVTLPRSKSISSARYEGGRSVEAGMTLLEVMVALVILAIGLLALAGMQITAIQANSGGFATTTAASLADQQMEQLKGLKFSNANLTDGDHTPTPATVTDAEKLVYSLAYHVDDGPPESIDGVKLISYTVSWTDHGIAHQISLMSRIGNENL